MTRHPEARIFQEMGFAARDGRLAEAVVYSIARTYSLLVRRLAQLYATFGLSAASFNLLMLLKHGQDPATFTQQEIGSRLVVSPSDMTGLIDRLEKRQLVRRAPGRDRRSKLLRITPKGSKLLDEVWPHHTKLARMLAEILEAGEAEALVRSLAKLRQAAPS